MHAPDAARARGVGVRWEKSGRLATLCHLGAGHSHEPTPGANMAMAHPLARAAPQVAQEGTHTMRLAYGQHPQIHQGGQLARCWPLSTGVLQASHGGGGWPPKRGIEGAAPMVGDKGLDCNPLLEGCI